MIKMPLNLCISWLYIFFSLLGVDHVPSGLAVARLIGPGGRRWYKNLASVKPGPGGAQNPVAGIPGVFSLVDGGPCLFGALGLSRLTRMRCWGEGRLSVSRAKMHGLLFLLYFGGQIPHGGRGARGGNLTPMACFGGGYNTP